MPIVTYIRGEDSSSSRVFLAIPAQAGIHVPCVASLVMAAALLSAAGIRVDFCFEAGNCHVDDARNSLIREFLKTDCTDLVFIDSDVGFRSEDLLRLVTLDRDLVAGVYPKKQDDEEFPVFTNPGIDLYAEPDGCVEVVGAPTGFMRIRRNVIEKMLEHYGDRQYHGQGYKEGDATYNLLFEREIAEGRRWSGDYNFCRRWRAIGGKVYVDPEMSFTHEGLKQWSGTLGKYWKRVHGVEKADKEAKISECIEHLKNRTETPQIIQDLITAWDNPWGAQFELAQVCIELGRNAKGPILECGSGLTTLILAAVSSQPVVALEDSPIWATYTQKMLDGNGLKAEIRCAPLLDHGWCKFYDAGEIPSDVAVVICDGPPRSTKGGRMGLSMLLPDIKDATVVLDDPASDTMDALGLYFDFTVVGSTKPVAISKAVSNAEEVSK